MSARAHANTLAAMKTDTSATRSQSRTCGRCVSLPRRPRPLSNSTGACVTLCLWYVRFCRYTVKGSRVYARVQSAVFRHMRGCVGRLSLYQPLAHRLHACAQTPFDSTYLLKISLTCCTCSHIPTHTQPTLALMRTHAHVHTHMHMHAHAHAH